MIRISNVGKELGGRRVLHGISALTTPADGWNNEVRDTELSPSDVVRTSDTVVTVTLPAVASYNVANSETIEVTVPASALQSSTGALEAPPCFVAVPDATPATVGIKNPLAQSATITQSSVNAVDPHHLARNGDYSCDIDHSAESRGTPVTFEISMAGAIVRGCVMATGFGCQSEELDDGGRDVRILLEK